MITTSSVGKVFPGEVDQLLAPNVAGALRYPAMFIHGAEAGQGALDWMTASPYRWPIIRTVVDTCQMYGVSADIGGSATWGNLTVQSRIDAMYAYSQTLSGVKKGKAVLIGQSMGGLAALIWAKNNPAKVACIVGIIPVTNLTFAHASSGYTAAINAAYLAGYSQLLYGAAHNPVTFAAQLAGIPGRLYVGSTDALARLADAQAVSATAASIQTVAVTGGHAESTLGQIDLADLESFLAAYRS